MGSAGLDAVLQAGPRGQERRRRSARTKDPPAPHSHSRHTLSPRPQAAGFSGKAQQPGQPEGKGCRKNLQVNDEQTVPLSSAPLNLLSRFSFTFVAAGSRPGPR